MNYEDDVEFRDDDGNVLEEPDLYNTWLDLHNSKGSTSGFLEHEKYKKAKERCLFDNHDLDVETIKHHINLGRTVEYFASFETLQLTPTALKQIGL